MSEIGKSSSDTEKELANAVEQISQGVRSIAEFKSASVTLNEVARQNSELAERLQLLADEINKGAVTLRDRGIAEFNDTLAKSIFSVRGAISDDFKSQFKNVLTILSNEQKTGVNQLMEAMKGAIKESNEQNSGSISQLRKDLEKMVKESTAKVGSEIYEQTRKVYLTALVLGIVNLFGVAIVIWKLIFG